MGSMGKHSSTPSPKKLRRVPSPLVGHLHRRFSCPTKAAPTNGILSPQDGPFFSGHSISEAVDPVTIENWTHADTAVASRGSADLQGPPKLTESLGVQASPAFGVIVVPAGTLKTRTCCFLEATRPLFYFSPFSPFLPLTLGPRLDQSFTSTI
jgi:hypothetical protein